MKTGSEKVKEICDELRRETLEPAKQKAEEMIIKAKEQAQTIIDEAEREAQKLLAETNLEIQRQKNIFNSSLHQAVKQALESLKQAIEEKLFIPELTRLIQKKMQSPDVIAHLIEAVIQAVKKEGIDANLSVYVPAAVPARVINEKLGQQIIESLKEKSVLVAPIGGGIEVKLHDHHITIDVSDTAIQELVANYIRKDFREMLFGDV